MRKLKAQQSTIGHLLNYMFSTTESLKKLHNNKTKDMTKMKADERKAVLLEFWGGPSPNNEVEMDTNKDLVLVGH